MTDFDYHNLSLQKKGRTYYAHFWGLEIAAAGSSPSEALRKLADEVEEAEGE